MAGNPATDPTAVATQAVAPLHLVVEEVEVTPAGKRRLVRVSVDRDLAQLAEGDHTSPVAPLSLDEVADATRAISAAFDEVEPFGQAAYVLEVTSPGVHRPLTQQRHFRRNVSRLVKLTLTDGTSLQGRVLAVDDATVTLAGEPTATQVALADIAKASVQVEFNRPDAEDPGEEGDDLEDDIADDLDEPADDADFDENEEH